MMLLSYRALMRCLGFAVLMCCLSGCASFSAPSGQSVPPREALAQFELEGRFSLLYEDKNYSGRLDWTYREASSALLLSSPFGQGLAEIVTDARGARLTRSDGKVFTAPDVQTLTQEVLGYPLPLAQMADWVRGEGRSERQGLDAQGRVAFLEQDGWRVDYAYADLDPHSPPVRMTIKRNGSFELRVIVQSWRRLSSEENPQ